MCSYTYILHIPRCIQSKLVESVYFLSNCPFKMSSEKSVCTNRVINGDVTGNYDTIYERLSLKQSL